ncbi:hypothetical protein ACERZ8_00940 [Tateyamaria armeniaca]|uniref:Uncharacterized protein n=1 Tax=Tateyamaria armeniaca TaxID=2518930 RepID=A0ABW8UN05_9RHOB
MTHENLISSFTAAVVDVRGGTYRGADIPVPGSANAHEIAKKLLDEESGAIIAANPIYGIADLIALIVAESQDQLKATLRESVRNLTMNERHNFIAGTATYIATEAYSKKPLTREGFSKLKPHSAWIKVQTVLHDPNQGVVQALMDMELVTAAIPVLGVATDLFLLVEADNQNQFNWYMDETLRAYRYITETQTGIISVPAHME